MPASKLEKQIRHTRTRKGVLVPLLEDLFVKPVEIDSQEDVDWLTGLFTTVQERQANRGGVFSPSQLAECLRYVYLLKNHEEHGIFGHATRSVQAHYYFFNGNFLHAKWQYALYKLDQKINDPNIFCLHGVEIPILSKHKDHGGTVDAICSIYEEPMIVDFKGLNVRTFQEITRGYVPAQYVIQLTDYGMLHNAATRGGSYKISRALLVSENKGGPDPKHPLALHEHEIQIATHLPDVRSRLKELRHYGSEKEVPPPECHSTGIVQFTGCPFRKFCKEEVREIERERRRAESKDAEGLAVSVPRGRRNHRSRRNSK